MSDIITTTADLPVSIESSTPEVAQEPIATPETPPVEKPAEVKERTFSQKELDDIVSKRLGKAQRAWERQQQQMLETALRARPEPVAAQQQAEDGEPDPTKFTDYADYLRAVSRYEAEQVFTRTSERNRQEREQASAREQQQTVMQNFEKQIAEGTKKFADFDEVALDPDVPISANMARVIVESDLGADLTYYLGKNREEAARIAHLPLASAARELGKIEAKLSAAPPAVEVSKAPPPVEPVGGRAAVGKDPGEMSAAEFAAWRKKFIAQRGR